MSNSVRILHVDDEPEFAETTKGILEQENPHFTVDTVTDVTTAMGRLSEYDCVVSDYEMGDTDGITFLEKVRADHPGLPFILFTGRGSEAIASEAISAGVTDYLQKQVGTEQYHLLANRIENAVSARRSAIAASDQHQQFEQILGTVPSGVLQLDTEGVVIFANEAVRDVLGVESSEIAGRHYQDLDCRFVALGDDPAAPNSLPFEAVASGGATVDDARYRIELADGTERSVTISGSPITRSTSETGVVLSITDITDRVVQERENVRLKSAIDHAHSSLTIADPTQEDCPLVYVNDAFEELTGYESGDVLGRNCRFLQGAETDSEAVAELRAAIDNEESATVELRNYRKDGTLFWNRLSITPIRDEDGTVTRYLGTQQDVTDRVEREQTLERTATFFETIIQASSNPVFTLSSDGTIRLWNQAAEMVFQYRRDEAVGRSIDTLDLLPVDEQTKLEAKLEAVLHGGTERERVQVTGKITDTLQLQILSAPFDEGDDTPGGIAVVSDVTSEDKARRALLEATDKFEKAFHYAATPMFIADPATDEFLDCNRAAASLLGVSRERVLNDLAPSDTHPESVTADLRSFFDSVIGEGEQFTDAIPLLTTDGDHREVEMSAVYLDVEGRDCVLNNVVDMTAHNEHKRQLTQQNERLDRFASFVSHDLRAPLRVAVGQLELAQAECDSDHLDAVADAHERMDDLLTDLLTLARAGAQSTDLQPLALSDVIDQVWSKSGTRDATLVNDTEMEVAADRSLLEQLLRNLFRNAVEHAGSEATVHVDDYDDGFYVADDGEGISADLRERAFDSGYSTQQGGAGFGLAIVRQIAEAHRWNVSITESESGGAKFEFETM